MNSNYKQSWFAGFRILLSVPSAFLLLLVFSFTSPDKATPLILNDIQQPAMQVVQLSLGYFQQLDAIKTIKFIPSVIKQETNKEKFTFTSEVVIKDEDTVDYITHFPGGYQGWMKYVGNNYNYPEEAINNRIQGNIFVQFTISENGEVSKPKVLRGIDLMCDIEALRIISLMPKWIPVIKNGNPVSFQYILPIKLKLAPEITDTTSAKNDEKPLLVVDQNPQFPGGYDAMLKYLHDKMEYPRQSQESGIQGKILVEFVVSKTGKISNVHILLGIGKECNEEAMRVVKEMPDWIPARLNGQPVPVMFQIPVKFSLLGKQTYY